MAAGLIHAGLYFGIEAAENAALLSKWRFNRLDDQLQRAVEELDKERSLLEPERLRERMEALDRLDAYFPDGGEAGFGAGANGAELSRRARKIRDRLEAVNREVYDAIRGEIQRGERPESLMRWVRGSEENEAGGGAANGMGYDFLDELVAGVFQFDVGEDSREPTQGTVETEPEMVFFQPTPARHIFSLIGLTALTAEDVLVDLGSGLGHIPMLVSACTGARCIGIELEAVHVERARQCTRRLKLDRVMFIQQDARAADLSGGTVFYLYTPFSGSILRTVLNNLKREAVARPIRICTYGPCTSVIAEETWLEAGSAPEMNRVAVFSSRV